MKLYGIKKEHIEIIRGIFEKYLADKPSAKVYLYGSRSTLKDKPFSDIDLTLKLKDSETNSIITKLKNALEDSALPYKVDLVNWYEIAKEYLPQIKIQKIPFWAPDEIEKNNPWRICPIGKHWTKTHIRRLKTGTTVIQSGYCKTNSTGKDLLASDEIEMIPSLDIFKKSLKPNANNLGYENGNLYDELIGGWVAYWNSVFEPSNRLSPNYVKVLIASESGFNPNSVALTKSKKLGKAKGLAQLTDETVRILGNTKSEIKDHFIKLGKNEIFDPNKNISACVRWLFRKRETSQKRLKRVPTWEEVLWEYKGVTTSSDKKSLEIKEKLKQKLELLNY